MYQPDRQWLLLGVTVGRHPHASPLLITAAAGYGKSTVLEAHRPDRGVVIPAATLASDGLPDQVSWVGVDDFDEVCPAEQERFVELLTGRADIGVALASRSPLDAAARARLSGQVSERDASDLALTPYEIAGLLTEEYGVTDPDAALRVADLTGGWPMLAHFAGDALGRDPHVDLATALTAPGAAAADWIRASVLDALPSGAEDLLRAVATTDGSGPITEALCDAVRAETGGAGAPGLVDLLRRQGVLVPQRRVGCTTDLVLVPAVARLLQRDADGPPSRAVVATIAAAHEDGRAWLPAARAHAVAGDRAAVVRLVAEHGEDMLRRGDARGIARLVERVIGEALEDEPPIVQRTYADALRMSGDPQRARRAYAPLVAAADEAGWRPGLAARVAQLHYMCGEYESALAVLDRCADVAEPATDGQDDEDIVDWWASRVHVLDVLGRPEDAQRAAERCLDTAERGGHARALGVAHLAAARTCRGTLTDLHHDHALRYAAQADDVGTSTRTLADRTYVLMSSARYDQACLAAREAARMARLACPPGLQASVLHNLGEALARTGQLDEALWQLECSIDLCRRLGPARAALGLVGTGDIHRALGHQEQSRAAYTEAVELARGSGEVQVVVSALCGQALLAADEPTPEAEDAVAEALRLASDDVVPLALTTAGRIALVRGDRAAAAGLAGRAVAEARAVRMTDLLAEALELEATVLDDPARAREALTEAMSIWSAGGAWPAVARVEVLIGRLPDAEGSERSRARDAARSLRRAGIQIPGGRGVGNDAGVVSISVLGPFTVRAGDAEVPLPAWRSKQARTLVKILAAHRGRVVTRARLCDLLWPDHDPARTGHRLSVLLATVRGVLDPAKAWPPDRYVTADHYGVRLDLGAVVLDADLLLRDAAHAAALRESGDAEGEREVLEHVDDLYRGDAFEDESEDWADGLREEVRAAWVRSVRRLAIVLSRAGRSAEALGLFARLLVIDPYDEAIHRRVVVSLVRSGRHGEARRAFERWCEAMRQIDAPAPDPSTVLPDVTEARAAAVLTPR